MIEKGLEIKDGLAGGDVAPVTFMFSGVENGITYPSYMPLDDFIDVERLRSLDGYIRERIRRRIAVESDTKFYTGPYRLDPSRPDRPGSRMIYLASSSQPDSYFDLDRTALWQLTPDAADLSLLMDFIATLPFESTGRMLVMYDEWGSEVPAHRDHVETEVLHEFIWFRTNLAKPFYVLNSKTGEKQHVGSYSAWFDTVNQFHGSDASGGLSFSIRVDGKFTKEFKSKMPVPSFNAASTPSLWAANYEQGKKDEQETEVIR